MKQEHTKTPENHGLNRYQLRVGRWGMYVHDLNTNKDIDMETVRDLLNHPNAYDQNQKTIADLVAALKWCHDNAEIIKEFPNDAVKYANKTLYMTSKYFDTEDITEAAKAQQ